MISDAVVYVHSNGCYIYKDARRGCYVVMVDWKRVGSSRSKRDARRLLGLGVGGVL